MKDSRQIEKCSHSAFRPVVWSIAWAVALLVLAEIGIGRIDWILRAVPRSGVSLVAFGLKDAVIAPSPDAHILILGTSRARGAFLPTVMESALGLERGQVLNLGVGGVHVQDAALLYEQAREIAPGAKTLVLQLDPFSFSRSRPVTERQCEWLSWRDRLDLGGLRAVEALACGLSHLNQRRPVLRYWLAERILHGRAPLGIDLDIYGRAALVTIDDNHPPENFTERTFTHWLNFYYKDFAWSDVFERHLLELVSRARADGLKVIVVHLPVVPDYLRRLRALPTRPYQEFRERIPALLEGLGVVQFWEQPEELGLRFRDFRDWGHLNTPGAERFSLAFADWMKKLEP